MNTSKRKEERKTNKNYSSRDNQTKVKGSIVLQQQPSYINYRSFFSVNFIPHKSALPKPKKIKVAFLQNFSNTSLGTTMISLDRIIEDVVKSSYLSSILICSNLFTCNFLRHTRYASIINN